MSNDSNGGWRKVRAPKPWKVEPGEVLEGIYLGSKDAEGPHGEYRKYIIAEDGTSNTYALTGTVADTLFMTGVVQPGVRIRVVFLGMVETATFAYKDYDLFVKDPVL
jgi:hypothetical protein